MTYQPFLPEAASGNIEPRHVVVPLRAVLHRHVLLITGVVTGIDHCKLKAGDRIAIVGCGFMGQQFIQAMNRAMEGMGGHVVRRYRLYERELSGPTG